jgi:hypothetical protein
LGLAGCGVEVLVLDHDDTSSSSAKRSAMARSSVGDVIERELLAIILPTSRGSCRACNMASPISTDAGCIPPFPSVL